MNKSKYYVGRTNDIIRRLNQHNNEPSCSYTRKYIPWRLRTYTVFDNKKNADEFELYLKKPSGKAFLTKRLI